MDLSNSSAYTRKIKHKKLIIDWHIAIINVMSHKRTATLDEIFSPTSVAIVGTSPERPFQFAGFHVNTLKDLGFPAIYPVNPRYKEVFGLPCYPSVSTIPGRVDHVIVCIPAEQVLELLDDCTKKGVNSVQFFTAGFSETGEKTRCDLENEMLKKARSGGFRIIGPNSTGMFVPRARLAQVPRLPMEPGGVAFISQSGGHGEILPWYAGNRGVRFSKVISYGNALDIGECELLEYFTADPETQIISMYIEGVRDGERFKKLLEVAARKKPVVIYKGGITECGLRTACSHTASLTSSVEVFQALCHQANAIQVNDIGEMVDVLVALCFARPYPQGRGMVVFGLGGGPSVQASDHLEQLGLTLSPFCSTVNDELKTFLPFVGGIFSNPLDAGNLINAEIIYKTIKVLAKSPEIDMMMYHLGFHPVSRWGDGQISREDFLEPATEGMKRAAEETGKPVLIALGPASDKEGMQELWQVQSAFVKAGLPVFKAIDKTGLAMSRVAEWYRRSKQMA